MIHKCSHCGHEDEIQLADVPLTGLEDEPSGLGEALLPGLQSFCEELERDPRAVVDTEPFSLNGESEDIHDA